jgi:hypothetical protein
LLFQALIDTQNIHWILPEQRHGPKVVHNDLPRLLLEKMVFLWHHCFV